MRMPYLGRKVTSGLTPIGWPDSNFIFHFLAIMAIASTPSDHVYSESASALSRRRSPRCSHFTSFDWFGHLTSFYSFKRIIKIAAIIIGAFIPGLAYLIKGWIAIQWQIVEDIWLTMHRHKSYIS